MKRSKLYFPVYEMLLFVMVAAVSVVLIMLQASSRQYTSQAEHLTNGVTAARSAAECWIGCDNIEDYQEASNASESEEGYIYTDRKGYDVVLNQTEQDGLFKAVIDVYYNKQSVYSLNISKAGSRYE